MKPILCACSLVLMPLIACADTVSLIPVADTTISEGSAATVMWNSDSMVVGRLTANGAEARARGLLRFDLSVLPPNATITSVSLTVTVARAHLGTMDVHALHRLNVPWVEASATWDSTGTQPWTGGSYEEETDSTVSLGGDLAGNSFTGTFPSTANLLATVQMWVTNAASNYGWVLLNEDEETLGNARRISSREALSGQPALTIDYTLPPPPPADFVVTSPGFHYAINEQEPNPELTLVRGSNYVFAVDTDPSHPFQISSGPGFGDPAYNNGVQNNNIFSGRMTFNVPLDAPDALYYVCSLHFFGGVIRIINPSSPPAPLVQIVSMDLSASNVVLRSLGTNGWLAFPEFSSNLVSSNWAIVPDFTNTLVNGTNVSVFDRLEPICGPNVFLRVRNTRAP